MKKILLLVILPFCFLFAEGTGEILDKETKTIYNPFKPVSGQSKIYYGGNIGLNFWNDYFYLGIYPFVGYKVTPKFSVGGKLGYTYYSYNNSDFSSHNYGASIFSRYRVTPQFYVHGEFVYFSYDLIGSERVWVPFLLLGGGYAQMVSQNVWIFVEVLFDVLQDSNSPYKNWDPFVSFGVGAGF